jgi:hypothetical protein
MKLPIKAIGDQRTAVWEPDFKRQLQSANKQNENEEYSGGSLRVTASGPGSRKVTCETTRQSNA